MILVGNVDDDAHRELVTAVVGTRTRLHVMGTATSLAWCAALAGAVTVASLLIHRHAHSLPVEAAGAFGLAGSGALIGVALGAPLHRPLVRATATSLVLALGGLLALVLLPPIEAVLRRAGNNDVSTVPWLTAAAVAVAVLSVTASALATEHRRT